MKAVIFILPLLLLAACKPSRDQAAEFLRIHGKKKPITCVGSPTTTCIDGDRLVWMCDVYDDIKCIVVGEVGVELMDSEP